MYNMQPTPPIDGLAAIVLPRFITTIIEVMQIADGWFGMDGAREDLVTRLQTDVMNARA